MKEDMQNPTETVPGCCPNVPEAIMTASRCELTDVKLHVIDGKLPEDLQGHVFIVAPVGSVNSGGLPYPNGTPIFNGDGMIYRLDFDQKGEVKVTTRIAKPPCYYADQATRPGSKYEKYRFRNHGMGRLSISLGLRNQLNTAFVPMKFSQEENDRLLLSVDAGRPYEIDTETLEVVTPVGWNKEWRPEASLKFSFPPVLSNAHPVFDPHTNEMFTANYGRSLWNLLESIPLFYDLGEIPKEIDEILVAIANFFAQNFVLDFFNLAFQFSLNVWQLLMKSVEKVINIEIEDFTYLIRWKGQGDLERWKLVLPDGSPVKIEQTMHQIAITKDYLVLMDTAFQFGIEQILNNPFPESPGFERLLRVLLTRPQLPDSPLYIVRRADLKAGQRPACSQDEVEVIVRKVVLPLEAIHFVVDYENPNSQITLHIAHICAWDGGQWLHKYDRSPYKPNNSVPDRLHGMVSEEVDISRMGRYAIDGETGEVIKSQVIYDSQCTWGIAFYTYCDRLTAGLSPGKLDNIYWTSLGLWKDLLTNFVFNLYNNYQYRAVPPEELLRLANQGKPAYLFRVDTTAESMAIADRYEFSRGYMVNSTQFIPRLEGQESSTNGYIVGTVFSKNSNEIWIFDAQNLGDGPLCRLSHPDLNFGYTIHTAWLPKIARRTASYYIPVRQDYEPIVKQMSPQIQELFEQEVYPHFEGDPRSVS